MHIDRMPSEKEPFSDLAPGDVFEYIDRVFFKLAASKDVGFNCADLENGTLASCDDDTLVLPRPEAELTGV